MTDKHNTESSQMGFLVRKYKKVGEIGRKDNPH